MPHLALAQAEITPFLELRDLDISSGVFYRDGQTFVGLSRGGLNILDLSEAMQNRRIPLEVDVVFGRVLPDLEREKAIVYGGLSAPKLLDLQDMNLREPAHSANATRWELNADRSVYGGVITHENRGAQGMLPANIVLLHRDDFSVAGRLPFFDRQQAPMNAQTQMRLSSDFGLVVWTSSNGEDVRIWDVRENEERERFIVHNDRIIHLAFLDATTLMTASREELITWDVHSREILSRAATSRLMAVSPDGSLFINSDGPTAVVRDIASQVPIARLTGYRSGLAAIEISPDNTTIFARDGENEAKLWRLP